MFVEIHTIQGGNDVLAGRILWDGQQLRADPPGSARLATILREPVYDPVTQRGLSAQANPEAFLRALQFAYHGAYLRASGVKNA